MLPALVLSLLAVPTAVAPSAPPAGVIEGADADALRIAARRKEARGDLAGAREAWLSAAPALPIGPERDAAVGAARAIEERLALRAELAAAIGALAGAFTELGIDGADDESIRVSGEPLPWDEADLALLRRAAQIARTTVRARLGVVQEAVARGTGAEKRVALADLARMVEKREIPAADAWPIVARARREPLPAGGYVLQRGAWKRAGDLAAAAESAALDAALERFESAAPDARDSALAALEARGSEGPARAAAALAERWQDALERLQRGTTLDQLVALAEQRAELDRRRASALELIFDEQRYFYPYAPPECPPERAQLYAGVQHEVNERVARVREAWRAGRTVRASSRFRAALEEILWTRAACAARKVEAPWPVEVPAWVLVQDPGRGAIDLATFAWDEAGAAAVARDLAVLARNERLWKQPPADAVRAPNAEEKRQVEVTNEYRRMLGRRALAWNASIQAASQKHADYMSQTGDFGHTEPDPARRTPADRLKAEGYAAGGSENCHAGDSGPDGAHAGWTQSSGHHRNLLMPGHREMASAIAGSYWCQNFGADAKFEAELGLASPDPAPRR